MTKETILILNKERRDSSHLKTFLEKEKYIVLPVNTIDRLLTNFQEFEVSGVIVDLNVDRLSLFEIIKKIRERLPELYVMMMVDGKIGEKEHQKVIETGVQDFFVKPMSYEKILFHLKSGLKQRKKYLQKRAES
ncbi:MAG: response regulator [Thermodesulfobacteriota bacterium]|nr:response regulator [Thermodesulfobacteriota bacterium]